MKTAMNTYLSVSRLRTAVAVLLLAAGVSQAAEKDYPCWRGANGSGVGPECGQPLVEDLSQAKLVWESEEQRMSSSYSMIQGGIGGCVVANDRVYATWGFPSGPVDAKLKEEARPFWEKVKPEPRGKVNSWKLRHMEALKVTEDELLDLRLKKAMDDFIICMDANTGKTVWKRQYENVATYNPMTGVGVLKCGKPKQGPHNLPCVAYGKVAALAYSGTLYCLDAATGKDVWSKPIVKPGMSHMTMVSVLYGAGNFITLLDVSDAKGKQDLHLAAFDAATGEVRWKWRYGYATTGKQGPVRYTHGGKDLIQWGGTCIDAATGKELWRVDGAADIGSPCVGEGYLVLGGSLKAAGLSAYKLDPDPTKAPTKAWSLDNKFSIALNCTPLIYRGHVYTKTYSDGSAEGGGNMMVCIELASGVIKSKSVYHTDAQASMFGGDGVVFEESVAFRADPADLCPIPGAAKFMVQEHNYAASHTPTYVAGRLYMKGLNSIRCYDLRAPKK